MRSRRWIPALVLGFSWAAALHAQPASGDRARATALFQEGRRLINEQRYAEACPKLEASQALDPGGGTLLNLALCYELAGRTATAWSTFKSAEAVAERDGRADRRDAARQHINALTRRVPHLVIVVSDRAPGLVVERDGVVVSAAALGAPLPVDPGAHEITAHAPGSRAFHARVDVQDGTSRTLTIPSLAPIQPREKPLRPESRSLASAYVAGAVGVIGLGVGTAFGVSALSKSGKFHDDCPDPAACTVEGQRLHDDAKRAADASTIAFAVGAVASGVAVYLFIDGSRSTSVGVGPRAVSVTRTW